MRPYSFFAVSTLVGPIAASPSWSASNSQGFVARITTGSPCAEVSASAASVLAASPSATPIVDGQLAYDCLNSVSLHQQEALDLFDSVIEFVYWQTDTNYLKDPPPAYLEPAVDVFAELSQVRSKIANGTYSSEYNFQADIFRVFNLAHDGHFRFFPDLLTGVIKFARGVGLVSVSEDGVGLPKIYTHEDVLLAVADSTFEPSTVTKINGTDAASFVENLSQLGALNDPDSLYNAMFFTLPFAVSQAWDGYFAGSARFGNIWPGPSTTLTFENGTSTTFTTTASVIQDFSGVTDGESFYEKFCTGPTSTSTSSPTTTTTSTSAPTATQPKGYPEPVLISSDSQVAGYYLDGENSDVAVLAMVSFDPDVPAEFQAVIQNFFADAKAAGKTKLVIDVSANGGGIILTGYDAFRQLFPQVVQAGYTRYLESDAFMSISEIFSAAIPADYSPETASEEVIAAYETPFNYRYDINTSNVHFSSFDDKFAPHVYEGYPYTNLLQWDLNDPLTTVNSTWGLGEEITGYGSRQNFTQPFAAEDIVLLYDGYCASTCTIFSEFMRLQGNVKSISIGGRPALDPMQTLGGVKGANNFGFSYISYLADLALNLSDASPSTDLAPLQAINSLADNRSTDNSINVRDNILPDDVDEGLPSQFVYEAADCRLFYTVESVVDITATWNAAANSAFKGAPCAVGGITRNTTAAKRSNKRHPKVSEGFARGMRQRDIAIAELGVPDKTSTWLARHGQRVPV
ncbi:hypothetical protein F5Y15DRAFT_382300 [Xylariaceae sp. FL0016]|nr:hypothetical protein F5Y15DRAFT_382300 [Xylariaceae sp. FL0016]